jgi:hypothetical protein
LHLYCFSAGKWSKNKNSKTKLKLSSMKKYLFMLFSLAIFMTSCQKDLAVQSGTQINDFALTTKDVHVEKGVMIFKDQSTFNKVIESLREMDKDKEFLSKNWKSRDKASSQVDLRDGSVPSYAVFDIFANQYSFNALLQAEREAEDLFLQQGGDPVDFHHTYTDDDFLQAVMNPLHEIMIGNVIYRFVDNDHAFMILNGDMNLLDEVRAVADPYTFAETGNIKFLDVTSPADLDQYDSFMAGPLACVADFEIIPFNGNDIILKNTSATMGGITSFDWKAVDANGVTFFTKSGTPVANSVDLELLYQSQRPNNPLPWNITFTISSTFCTAMSVTKTWGGLPCQNINFTRVVPNNITPGTYRLFRFIPFNAASGSQLPNGTTVNWNFGDGSTATSTVTATSNGSIEHEYPASTPASSPTVTCSAFFPSTGCLRTATGAFAIRGCGVAQPCKDGEVRYASNSRRLCATIWMDNNFFYSSVGGKSYNYTNVWWGWKRSIATMTMQWSSTSRFKKDCHFEQSLSSPLPNAINDVFRDDRFKFCGWFNNHESLSAETGTVQCTFTATSNGGTGTVILNW